MLPSNLVKGWGSEGVVEEEGVGRVDVDVEKEKWKSGVLVVDGMVLDAPEVLSRGGGPGASSGASVSISADAALNAVYLVLPSNSPGASLASWAQSSPSPSVPDIPRDVPSCPASAVVVEWVSSVAVLFNVAPP